MSRLFGTTQMNLLVALTALFAYLFADMLIRHMPISFDSVIVGAALAGALWLLVHRQKASRLPLGWPLAIYGLGLLITTAFSISVYRSLDEVLLFGVYLLALWCASTFARYWGTDVWLSALRNASWLLIAVVVLITIFSLATGGNLRPPSPNVLAAVFNLLLLPTLAELIERPRWPLAIQRQYKLRLVGDADPKTIMRQYWPLAIWSLAALTVIFITASRGGWFGLAAGLLTLAAHKRAAMAGLWSQLRRFWPVAVPVGAVAIIWQVTRMDHSTRWPFWVVAVAVFLYRPLIGAGPGTFNLFWSHLYPPPYFQAMHAHSMIFNTGAEQGIIGLIALAIMAVAVIRASWRDAGLLAAVMAFAAHNLVDDLDKAPAVMVVLAVLLGSRLIQAEH